MCNREKLNVCIGFDVSSSTIGISNLYVLNNKIIKADYFYYKPSKKQKNLNGFFESYDYIKKTLINIKKEALVFCGNKYDYNFNVFVEDFILFMPHKSSAKTITTLAVYNRMVCLTVYDSLGINPILYPITTIRSVLKKMSNMTEKIDKQNIPKVLDNIINKFWDNQAEMWKFNWVLGKKTKLPIVENYDMADSIAVNLCGINKNKILKTESAI